MEYNKEYAKKVYAGLTKRGYTADMLGDETKFVERMANEDNRRYLYDQVQKRGDAKMGSWEHFNSRMMEAVSQPPPQVEAEPQQGFLGLGGKMQGGETAEAPKGEPEELQELFNIAKPTMRNIPDYSMPSEDHSVELIRDPFLREAMSLRKQIADKERDIKSRGVASEADREELKQLKDAEANAIYQSEHANAVDGNPFGEFGEFVEAAATAAKDFVVEDVVGRAAGAVMYPIYKTAEGIGDVTGIKAINRFGKQGAERAVALAENRKVNGRSAVEDEFLDARNNILYKNGKDGDLTLIGTLFQATEELVAGVTDPIYEGIEWVGDKAGWDVVEEIGTTGRANVDKIYENSQYKDNSFLGQVVQLIPQIAGTATSLATGNPIPAKIGLMTMVGSSMGSAAREAEKEGASPLEQLGAAFFDGAIELVTERLSLGHWLGKMASKIGTKTLKEAGEEVVEKEAEALFKEAKKEFGGKITAKTVKEFAKDLAVEGGSEATAEFLQTFVPIIYRDKDKWPTWHEAFQNAWDGAVGGFLMTGMLHSVGTHAQRKANDKRWSEQGYIDAAMVTLKDKKGKDNLVVAEVVGEDENGNISILSDNKIVKVSKEDIKTRQQFSYADFKNNVMSIYRSEGYNVNPTSVNGNTIAFANKAMNDAKNAIRTALNLSDDADVDAMIAGKEFEGAAKDAVDKYLAEKARYEGMRDRLNEERDNAIAEANKSVDEIANNGMVYTTTIDGEVVYITGGKVVLTDEGLLSPESEGLVALMPNDEKEAVNYTQLHEKVEVSNAEEMKAERVAEINNRYKNQLNTFVYSDEMGDHTVQLIGRRGNLVDVIVDGRQMEMGAQEYDNIMAEVTGNGKVEGENEVQPVVAPVGQKGEKAEKVVEPVSEVAAPVVEAPKTALEQIPRNEKNVPLYEQVDSELAWDGVVEEAGGNEETAMLAVNSMVEDKKSALAAAEKAKAKAGATITEKIAAENERVANIEKAKADLAKWEEIAGVKAKRETAQAENVAQPVAETAPVEESAPIEEVETPQATNEMQPVSEPVAPTAEEIADAQAFAEASSLNTVEAYQNYLDNHPEGAYREGARAGMWMIEGINPEDHGRNVDARNAANAVLARVPSSVDESQEVAEPVGETDSSTLSQTSGQVVDNAPGQSGVEEIQEPRSVEETLENGDKRITNYNSRGEVATVVTERDGKVVSVDSYDEGVLFEHTEYDGNGKAASVTRYDKNGNAIGTQKYVDGKAKASHPVADKVLETAKKKQQARFADHAKVIAEKLGVEVTVHNDESTVTNRDAMKAIAEGGEVKGWYNPTTGEIALFLPAMESMRDVESTILHEAVSHYGIKHFLGKEDFNKFLDGVWEMMPAGARAFYLDYVGADMKNPSKAKMRQAADEYVAHIAEKMDLDKVEKSIWNKLLDAVFNALRKIGFKNLTRRDIETVIRASYKNLRQNGGNSQVTGQGETMARKKLPKAEYEVLRQAVMANNSLYGKNKPIETAFTAENFYIYNNYGDDSFSVIRAIPIEGNEDLIDFYNNSIQNGTYGNNEDFSKAVATFRSQQKQRNSSERTIEGQRGENGRPISLDLRQSSERGGDNAQGNSNERGEVNPQDSESGIRFRKVTPEMDAEYMSAVENGDMETAERLVKEAAKLAMPDTKVMDEDGYPMVVYHGSEEDFNVFDKTKGRANMDIQGMFFSPWNDDARGYGSNVRAFYLNITNPANESTGYKALNKFQGQNGAGIKAREYLVSAGYDGVNNEDQEFVAFDPNQIKSADAVTYDNNGNVIPLSERFNEEKEDIRFRRVFHGSGAEFDGEMDAEVRFSRKGGKQNWVGKAEVPNLIGVHSTTADKLRKAIKQGGLANPSAAVMTVDSRIPKYGEISFVLPSSMVDKVSGRNAGTYTGDAWTPTYPMTFEKISSEGMKRLEAETKDMPLEKQNAVIFAIEEWIEHNSHHWLPYAFLQLRGIDVQAPDKATRMIERVCRAAEFLPWDRLGSREKSKVVELYKEAEFGGDEDAYKKHLEAVIAKLEELKDNNDGVFKSVYEREITAIEKNGFFADEVEEFLDGALADFQANTDALSAAENVIRENGLVEKYEDWKNGLKDLYAGSYFHADGKDIENTLENVSNYMASRKPAGSEEFADNIKKFAASHMDNMASLDDIRRRKYLLSETNKDRDDFITEWDYRVYRPLVEKLDRVFASGRERIQELAMQEDPKEYAKKEYGIELTDEDVEGLGDMIQAIKTEYPTPYFETKFNRPVYFNEFAGVALPENVGEDIVEALNNAGLKIETYEPGNEKARTEAIKRLTEEDDRIMFRRANKNQEIFVSNAQRAVEGIKQEKATPEQWIAMLKKNGGLKAGEEAWLGLEEWLNEKQGAVTKQEILDFIGENRIKIEEVVYANASEMEDFRIPLEKSHGKEFADKFFKAFDIEYGEFGIYDEQEAVDLYNEANGADIQLDEEGYWDDFDDREDILNWASRVMQDARGDAREIYHTRLDYTTDGLNNKREIALVVPTVESYNIGDYTHFGDAGNGRAVAWVRFGETTDSEGNRVLVIDEIQSKRHQDGREKGYKSSEAQKLQQERDALYDKMYTSGLSVEEHNRFKELGELLADVSSDGVPSAPFEKNWHELAMKRMLRLAAEEGFDKVAWTTGEQQAERYSLGAVLKGLKAYKTSANEYYVIPYNNGAIGEFVKEYTEQELADTFGKELAQKIITNAENATEENPYEIEGEELRVGGEGMKGFYDRMLPSFVQKYTKKWGAKVGEVTMPNLRENNTMHSVDVTPEMKESVMEGQTMFSRAFGGNSGYVGYSMSKRAAEARAEGRFPKTDFKKEYGVTEKSFIALVKAGMIDGSEWHHTSMYGNKTNFYRWDEPEYADYYKEHKKEIDKAAREESEELEGMLDAVKDEVADKRHQEFIKEQEETRRIFELHKEYENFLNTLPMPEEFTSQNGVKIVTNGSKEKKHWKFYDLDGNKIDNPGRAVKELRRFLERQKPSFVEWKAKRDAKQLVREIVEPFAKEKREEQETMFRMGSRVDARMAEVASHFDGKELSAEQRAVADVFGGKADNLTISVKTQDGNTRNVEMRQGNDLAGAKHSLYAHYGTTKGVINADDLLLIPDVIANGERTENGKKAVYKLDVNGTKYTVVTYVKQNKEEFHNFYSNKKGQPSQSVNASIGDTHSARITEELASADKGSTSSAEMQEGETLFSKRGKYPELTPKQIKELRENAKAIRRLHNVTSRFPITALRYLGGALETQEQREAHDRLFAERDAITNEGKPVEEQYNPQAMTLQERITESLLKLANKEKENVEMRLSAIKAYGHDLANYIKLMNAQKGYDRKTVRMFTDFVKMYLRNNAMDGLSSYKIARLMNLMQRATGGHAKTVNRAAVEIAEIITGAHTKQLNDIMEKQIKTGREKVNASGVVVQGGVDIIGKRILNTYKDAINLDDKGFEEKYNDSFKRVGEIQKQIQENGSNTALENQLKEAQAEADAMLLAATYRNEVKAAEADITKIKNKLTEKRTKAEKGEITWNEYHEFAKTINSQIVQLRAQQIDAYQKVLHALSGDIYEGVQRARAFREAEAKRVQRIHDMAENDMNGVSKSAERKEPGVVGKTVDMMVYKNPLTRAVMHGLGTYENYMKYFGRDHLDGRGELFEYFMTAFNQAQDKEWKESQNDFNILEAAAQKIFGKKKIGKTYKTIARDSTKGSGVILKYWDGGAMVERELTIGQLMYLYMTEKQAEGQMKLRNMGLTEEKVQNAVAKLPAKYKAFADYIQTSFLPEMRPRMNEVHQRMFGASMSEVENYFPLKVNQDARKGDTDLNNTGDAIPSTITGAVIKRRVNVTPIDLTANAFDVLNEHIVDMEHWAAYAEFTRDNNTLINDNDFKNRVKNTKSVRYGDGEKIWEDFVETARITTGNYQQRRDYIAKLMSGANAAKITFGYYTALKQLSSLPAFLADANAIDLVWNTAKAYGSWQWAIKNLPGFEERWKGRTGGNERLGENEYSIHDSRIMKAARMAGMTPNAFIDAVVVASGARAVYNTRLRFYKSLGLTNYEADKRAKNDAAISYNETQQSGQGAYLSRLQKEGGIAALLTTLFRNSQMAFQRRVVGSMVNTGKKLARGERIREATKRKYMQMGMDEATAEKRATMEFYKSYAKDITNLAIFGYGMNYLWVLMGQLPYLLFGDDDEEKEKIYDQAKKVGVTGMFEGFTLGNVAKAFYENKVNGTDYAVSLLEAPFEQDLDMVLSRFEKDGTMAGILQLGIFLTEMNTGISPQRLIDDLAAVIDLCDGDVELANDGTLFALRLLKAPQSQQDMLILDELEGADAERVKKVAEKFIEYKMTRNFPFGSEDEKRVDKYANKFVETLKERVVKDYDPEDISVIYDQSSDTEKEILKKKWVEEMDKRNGTNAAKSLRKEKIEELLGSPVEKATQKALHRFTKTNPYEKMETFDDLERWYEYDVLLDMFKKDYQRIRDEEEMTPEERKKAGIHYEVYMDKDFKEVINAIKAHKKLIKENNDPEWRMGEIRRLTDIATDIMKRYE